MSQIVLGLDLGPNSIGWALVRENGEDSELIDLGVRVFTEGVDAFDTGKEASRNESRRVARGMRRQTARRSRRKRELKHALIEAGLYPAGKEEQDALEQRDPYELRARALDERLTPFEMGRVLLHLNQRRGFKSNRKSDRGDKEVSGMLAEISELAEAIRASGARTYGEYLHRRREAEPLARVRNQHTRRDWFLDEFDQVWTAQQPHHPQVLTERLRYGTAGKQSYPLKPTPRQGDESLLAKFGIEGMLFFQRPMYWPASVIGKCELEPKEKRCPRADRAAQRFRLLQEVNNLRYVDPDTNEDCPLNEEQRAILLDYMASREKASFDQIRKKLGFLESVRFNLERGKRASIKGHVVDAMMAKSLDKGWHDWEEARKDGIVRVLADPRLGDEESLRRLTEQYELSGEQAEKVMAVPLPEGHVSLSQKAIEKMLPHLEQGLVYQSISDPEQSALHAAGYLRRDELQRRLFDELPNPAKVNPKDCKLGDIPNPVVKRALVELKKVVNAILREYGKPDAVHVELAREVQQGQERRRKFNAKMRENEAEREAAAEAIRKLNLRPTRDTILLYRLWKSQNHECIYCGKAISQQQLFGSDADVDHILPKSRSLDDAQANKVVCHRACNHSKGQQTPYEWLAYSDKDRYEAICQRAASLLRKGLKSYGWYRRFRQKELQLDSFIARQLTDTGYIARATVEYLRLLFENDHAVLGLKGQLTSELRWQWRLDTILQELPDSPGWQDADAGKLRPGEKNRSDHRHHAIDAVVVALTNRSRLQKLSEIVRKGGTRKHGEILLDPWEGFRDEVKARIADVNVSHRVDRQVAGGLHKDNPFGRCFDANGDTRHDKWVKRKRLKDCSASELLAIRDAGIKKIVEDHLERAHDLRVKVTKSKKGRPKIEFEYISSDDKVSDRDVAAALNSAKMPSGVPIKKVRLVIANATIQQIRKRKVQSCKDSTQLAFVEPEDQHHACLFEWEEDGKIERDAVYVTRLEAAKRLLNKENIVIRIHPDNPEARFLFSVCTGDLVLARVDGVDKLMVVSTMVSTQKRIHLVDACDARRSAQKKNIGLTPNTFLGKYNARKVTVDPLGRIRWAND